MLMALILLSFLLFIVALIVMPKRIYEAFQKRDFSSFGKKMALVLADMLLFGLSFFAVMAESGEVLFGISLSLVAFKSMGMFCSIMQLLIYHGNSPHCCQWRLKPKLTLQKNYFAGGTAPAFTIRASASAERAKS